MYYQLKLIRKKEKNATYRIVCIPADITFTQLALILEESLESVKTNLYEFEFLKEKYRMREMSENNSLLPNSNYNYLHAPDTYINFWLETQPWFTFRILDEATGRRDSSFPEYRAEFVDKISRITDEIHDVEIHHPVLLETRRATEDPYWGDDDQVNMTLESLYELHEGNAEYPDFNELLDSVLIQKNGIAVSSETVDRDTRNRESKDAGLHRTAEQLNLKINNAMTKVIADYYEQDGDEYRLKVPEEELRKILEKKEKEVAADLAGEFEDYLNKFHPAFQPENVKLKDVLMSYSKKTLISEAHDFDLQINEKNRKEVIADEIVDFLLDPEQMQELFLFVSAEELDAFEKVMNAGFYRPTPEDEKLLWPFYDLDYLAVYESGKYSVPGDVEAVYQQLVQKGYRDYHSASSWLLLCLKALDLIHGFAPVRVLYSMFRKGKPKDFTYEDFLQLLDEFPEGINPCRVSDGNVMSALLRETGMYDTLRTEQSDVMYYIPSKEEIESYGTDFYPSRDPAYRELYRWMGSEFGQDEEDCEYYCATACRIFSMGANPTDFLQEMTDRDLAFRSQEQLGKTIDILNRVLAHTRQARLRGHTTDEMAKMMNRRPVKSTLSPASAGDILKIPEKPLTASDIAAGPGTFHGEVIPVDFTAGSGPDPAGREKKKKIGPNDPCPCGSGKKYKKCCGRNRGF